MYRYSCHLCPLIRHSTHNSASAFSFLRFQLLAMEAPLLKRSPSHLHLLGDDGDYLQARGLHSWWRIFCIESLRLWAIGGPIAFQVICQFATSFVATIFVGHLGDVELSAFSIAVSVVGTFSFGFMVSFFNYFLSNV